MNALQKGQRILIGLAIGVVLALLIAPETSWIKRRQLATVAALRPLRFAIGLKDEPSPAALYRPIAENNPYDYQMQLAYVWAVNSENLIDSTLRYPQDGDPGVLALRQLIPSFPDNPSLYANILRYSVKDELRTGDRPESW